MFKLNKKIFSIRKTLIGTASVAIAGVLIGTSIPTVIANASTIYVTNGSVAGGQGSSQAPYTTLEWAIQQAQAGDTIVLKENLTVAGLDKLVIDKDITIDAQGYTITFRGANLEISENANVTIKNANVTTVMENRASGEFLNKGNLTLDTVTTLISTNQADQRPTLTTEKTGKTFVLNGSHETAFDTIKNSGVTTVEGTNVRVLKSVEITEDSEFISGSNHIAKINGPGKVTFKDANISDVELTSVKDLHLETEKTVVTLKENSVNPITDTISGSGTLNTVSNSLEVKKLETTDTFKYTMNHEGNLVVETLNGNPNIEIKDSKITYTDDVDKEYVSVTTLNGNPNVTLSPENGTLSLKKEDSKWILRENTEVDKSPIDFGYDYVGYSKDKQQLDTNHPSYENYRTATPETKANLDKALENAKKVYADPNATEQDVLDAEEALYNAYDNLEKDTNPQKPSAQVDETEKTYKLSFIVDGDVIETVQTTENATMKGLTKENVMKHTLSSLYEFVEIKTSADSKYIHDNDNHVYVIVKKKEFNFDEFLKEIKSLPEDTRYQIAKDGHANKTNTQSELTQPQLDQIEEFLNEDTYNQELLKVINEAREKEGSKPLKLNTELSKGIELRAQEQAGEGYIRSIDTNNDGIGDKQHTRPDGKGFASAFTDLKNVSLRSENAGQFHFTDLRELISEKWHAETQFGRLKTSPSHNKNMMDNSFTEAYFAMALSDDHFLLLDNGIGTSREDINGQASIFMQAFGVERSIKPINTTTTTKPTETTVKVTEPIIKPTETTVTTTKPTETTVKVTEPIIKQTETTVTTVKPVETTVKVTEPIIKPTETTVTTAKPTETTVKVTEPIIKPTETTVTTVKPTETTVKITEPIVKQTETTVTTAKPTETTVKITEPIVKQTETTVTTSKPVETTVKVTEPIVKQTETTVTTSKPVETTVKVTEPIIKPTETTVTTAKPTETTVKVTEPIVKQTETTVTTAKPIETTVKVTEPIVTTEKPIETTKETTQTTIISTETTEVSTEPVVEQTETTVITKKGDTLTQELKELDETLLIQTETTTENSENSVSQVEETTEVTSTTQLETTISENTTTELTSEVSRETQVSEPVKEETTNRTVDSKETPDTGANSTSLFVLIASTIASGLIALVIALKNKNNKK